MIQGNPAPQHAGAHCVGYSAFSPKLAHAIAQANVHLVHARSWSGPRRAPAVPTRLAWSRGFCWPHGRWVIGQPPVPSSHTGGGEYGRGGSSPDTQPGNGDSHRSEELADALVEWVGTQLSKIARPEEVRFVDKLPKTRSGKIMRRLLRAELLGQPIGDTSTLED